AMAPGVGLHLYSLMASLSLRSTLARLPLLVLAELSPHVLASIVVRERGYRRTGLGQLPVPHTPPLLGVPTQPAHAKRTSTPQPAVVLEAPLDHLVIGVRALPEQLQLHRLDGHVEGVALLLDVAQLGD